MAAEARLEREFCRRVEDELGLTQTKFVAPGQRGWPDRIVWLPGGSPLIIEFKSPGETADPLQVIRHNRLRKLGYLIEVHDSWEAAFASTRLHLGCVR